MKIKIKINFIDSRQVVIDAKSVQIRPDQDGTLTLYVMNGESIVAYLVSTIASVEYEVEKPHIKVNSVFVW